MSVSSSQSTTWRTPATPQGLVLRNEARCERDAGSLLPERVQGVQPWQLNADDVQALTTGQLRELLRQSGVPTKRRQSQEELLGKLLPLMDEVQRSKVSLQAAVEAEDYAAAQEIAASKSQRAYVDEALQRAVEEERFALPCPSPRHWPLHLVTHCLRRCMTSHGVRA